MNLSIVLWGNLGNSSYDPEFLSYEYLDNHPSTLSLYPATWPYPTVESRWDDGAMYILILGNICLETRLEEANLLCSALLSRIGCYGRFVVFEFEVVYPLLGLKQFKLW